MLKEVPGRGFRVKDVPRPTPGHREALVEVRAAGICGSDIPIFEGSREVPLPLIPGHEFSGVVVELGPGALDAGVGRRESTGGAGPGGDAVRDASGSIAIGDRVTAGLVISCGRCRFCVSGDEPLCEEFEEIGITRDGAFAQYVVVPVKNLRKMPDSMSFVEGASVDPVASAYRAVARALALSPERPLSARSATQSADAAAAEGPLGLAWPQEYRTALILGPGPIGLYALQIVKALGAQKAIVAGTRRDRLHAAKQLGADEVIDVTVEDLPGKLRELSDGAGADVIIEATGNPNSVAQAVSVAAKRARIVLAGVFRQPASFDVGRLMRGEMLLTGSLCYSLREFEESMDLISSGKVTTKGVVTHRLPLSEMKKALELVRSRQAIKVVLEP